jgi:DNA invertase Pin-like site-specific DNA recombinase
LKPKAYSYVRFSSTSQRDGDSLNRQIKGAEEYCLNHGLELSTKNYRDLGLSGFKDIERPSLDDMLEAITTTKSIKADDYIILENLDRLSRRGIDHTQDIIKKILRNHVKIVCLHDNLLLNYASLNDLTATIRVAIAADMAYKSSEHKSKRISASWASKHLLASEQGLPKSAKVPAWLQLSQDRKSFQIIKSKAKVIRKIFALADSGLGAGGIATKFNKEAEAFLVTEGAKVPKQWHASSIKKILSSGSVIGILTPTKVQNGKRVADTTNIIENYYPLIIDKALYYRVAQKRKALDVSGGSIKVSGGRLSNLLQKVAKCKCHQPMQYLNKAKGQNQKYLRCSAAAVGKCDNKYLYSYAQIERVILVLLQTTDFSSLFPDTGDKSINLEHMASLELKKETLNNKLIDLASHDNIKVFDAMIRQTGHEIEAIDSELLELKSAQLAYRPLQDQAQEYKNLANKALEEAGNIDIRVRLNVLLRDKLYIRFNSDNRKSCNIGGSGSFSPTIANLKFPSTNITEVYTMDGKSYPEFMVIRDNLGKLNIEIMHDERLDNPFS